MWITSSYDEHDEFQHSGWITVARLTGGADDPISDSQYRDPSYFTQCMLAFTNTTTKFPYRGSGCNRRFSFLYMKVGVVKDPVPGTSQRRLERQGPKGPVQDPLCTAV